ncbi:MAG: hypothetical protein ISS78_01215 [Phycisphaerae bacterium]|nr:hypothetical protein [Phycisphaerae bacterium]
MKKPFKFINPGRLVDGDLELILVRKHPADSAKKHVPSYEFKMRRIGRSQKAGYITLRVGSARALHYRGHIGYRVNKRYRGHRYGARSCRPLGPPGGLLLPLALAHGLKSVWLSTGTRNVASQRTCELAGARYVDTVRIPKDHPIYKWSCYMRRYRINVKKELQSNR